MATEPVEPDDPGPASLVGPTEEEWRDEPSCTCGSPSTNDAAGAYGANVRDPSELEGVLKTALAEVREGRPAVVAVWLARHLQVD